MNTLADICIYQNLSLCIEGLLYRKKQTKMSKCRLLQATEGSKSIETLSRSYRMIEVLVTS